LRAHERECCPHTAAAPYPCHPSTAAHTTQALMAATPAGGGADRQAAAAPRGQSESELEELERALALRRRRRPHPREQHATSVSSADGTAHGGYDYTEVRRPPKRRPAPQPTRLQCRRVHHNLAKRPTPRGVLSCSESYAHTGPPDGHPPPSPPLNLNEGARMRGSERRERDDYEGYLSPYCRGRGASELIDATPAGSASRVWADG